MGPGDSDIGGKFKTASGNDPYDEEYSPLKTKKTGKFGSNLLKKTDGIPLSRFGIGFLILAILLILLFTRSRSSTVESRILALENRMTNLEESIAKFEAIDDRVAQIWEQAQTFEQFKERFQRSEASLILRMDQMTKNLDNLKKQMNKSSASKAKPSTTTTVSKKTAKKRFHTVKPGETLYKIGRQYGLTVEKMRHLNKLPDGAAIHPGQKLLVSP
jgi:LysM repeat protein